MNYPKWLDDAVFYEIYPQSFNDTNDDGIGDLQGIIEKLDYIKELGFNALWLNPCFDSPFLDAGYDISDYLKVAPRYGTNDDARMLFEESHKRGMHILLDLVPGHTSIYHPWFKESCKATRNDYTDRYVWTDSAWKRIEGMNCLNGVSERDGTCAVNFFIHQPALNYGFYQPDPDEKWQQSWDAPGPQATIDAMKNIMKFWLDMGCDGFRVDMASSLVKNDPESLGTIKLWQYIMEFLTSNYPDAAMVSEWGEPDKALRGGFHMDFLLHFGPSHYNDLFRCDSPYFSENGTGSIDKFVEKYLESAKKAGEDGLICIPSGNHDMLRLSHFLSEAEQRLAFAFLLTMPGVPFIYYGDEIGMRYVEGLNSFEGGYERTGSRTPMQWNGEANCGFSNAPKELLYLPQDDSDKRPTVAQQMADAKSLLNEIKKLIQLRKENEALHNRSKISFISIGYPLIYSRIGKEQTMVIVINPSNRKIEINDIAGRIVYSLGKGGALEPGNSFINPISAIIICQD